MNEIKNYISLDLEIKDNKIINIFEPKTRTTLKTFTKPLTEKSYKLYIIKSLKEFLYIGITRQPLRSRIHSGLNSKGKNGYYGYKWQHYNSLRLFVWVFDNYNKIQMESIEAELVYLVRNKTNRWPNFQNEIHFNNDFNISRTIALKIFEILH